VARLWRRIRTEYRSLKTVLTARFIWRYFPERRPKQLGTFVRYTDDPDVNRLSEGLINRLRWLARIAKMNLINEQEIRKPPTNDGLDALSYVGSVGWKADVQH
jgi:hypothetical protein